MNLDLQFTVGEEIAFFTGGANKRVFLSGYLLPDDTLDSLCGDEDNLFDDEEGEEEEEEDSDGGKFLLKMFVDYL